MPEHPKRGGRVIESKHRFIAYPFDGGAEPPEGIAHVFLETTEHADRRRVSIDVGERAESRQVDECDRRDRRLKAVVRSDV